MLEVATIFRDCSEKLKSQHAWRLEPVHYRAIDDITKCRTPEIGSGLVWACPNCEESYFVYRSCGNRNCPKCGREKVTSWLKRRQDDILPINYYMATFSLPAEFRPLCRRYPTEMYNLFFKTASIALKKVALNPRFLGGTIGMIATLQTWRRDGEFHPHLHILIPGGAISTDGKQWLYPRNRKFLMPAKSVGKKFREEFQTGFKKIDFASVDAGVGLDGTSVPAEVWKKNFVVDIRKTGNGMSTFKYVAPYMQRGFINNGRLKKYDGRNVTFEYKESKTRQIKYKTLSALTFMILYLKHVLPSGFQKTRYYGLEAAVHQQKRKGIRLLILLSRQQEPPEKEDFTVKPVLCPKCKTPMQMVIGYCIRPPPGVKALYA